MGVIEACELMKSKMTDKLQIKYVDKCIGYLNISTHISTEGRKLLIDELNYLSKFIGKDNRCYRAINAVAACLALFQTEEQL